MATVALDVMGGDHAPAETLAGALAAAEDGIDVVLVGDEGVLAEKLGGAGPPIVHTTEVVGMDEDAAIGLRAKPRASIRVAAELVAGGDADALVSAGSTGATVTAALLELGRLPGVRRPAIAAVLPGHAAGPGVVLVDAGANADGQPELVASFAPMGVAYSTVLGIPEPRVGLLNTGAEPGKGSALVRAVYELLAGRADFVGNVEPQAVLAGAVDVVVADGFAGNLLLKTVEALAPQADDAHPGGALLLGVAGEVLVAHGDADRHTIRRALRTAARLADAGLSAMVAGQLSATATPGGTAHG